MAISGFLFLSWRLLEILITVPIVGMLSWIVQQYVNSNLLTPSYVLVMFIVSVLALAWALFTVLSYLRARHDAWFVAFVDLLFFGAFIAGVVELRGFAGSNCNIVRAIVSSTGTTVDVIASKQCDLLKASFALGIIDVVSFFITFLFALLVARNHRNDDRVIVRREYHSSRHNHRRGGSRDNRSSRDYAGRGYDNRRSNSNRSQYESRRTYV